MYFTQCNLTHQTLLFIAQRPVENEDNKQQLQKPNFLEK